MAQALTLSTKPHPIIFVKAKAHKIKENWNAFRQNWRTYKLESGQMTGKMEAFKQELAAYNKAIAEINPIIDDHGESSRTGLALVKLKREEAQALQEKARALFKAESPLFERINAFYAPRDSILMKTLGFSIAGLSISAVTGLTDLASHILSYPSDYPSEIIRAVAKPVFWLWNISTAALTSSWILSNVLNNFRKPWKDTWEKVGSIKDAKISSIPNIARIEQN